MGIGMDEWRVRDKGKMSLNLMKWAYTDEVRKNTGKEIIILAMKLAIAIVVIVGIFIVLMGLFFLVTRYYNYRLSKSLQDPTYIFSMIDGIQGEPADCAMPDDEYDDFIARRIEERKERQKKSQGDKDQEMSEVCEALNEGIANIYGIKGRQKRVPALSIPTHPESTRSLVSAKPFSPNRLNRIANSPMGSEREDFHYFRRNTKAKVMKHKYISKMVAYTEEGLSVISNQVKEVWLQNDKIKETSSVSKEMIASSARSFMGQLEAYGFEREFYGACKYLTTLQIPNMRPNEVYPAHCLKRTEVKEEMNFPSFYYEKQEMGKSFSGMEEEGMAEEGMAEEGVKEQEG